MPGAPITVITYIGNTADRSQSVLAWEAGYRWQPARTFNLDLALYHNNYDNLPSYQNGVPFLETTPQGARVIQPIYVVTRYAGATFGGEVSATWLAHPRWRLAASYSLLESRVPPNSGRGRIVSVNSPEHQARLGSHFQVSRGVEWEVNQYYAGPFRTASARIAGRLRADTRLGWRWNENVEWSVAGQNLFTRRRLEFSDVSDQVHPTMVHRAVLGKITWTF
jgi:iron complex outermembrane receptor protein